MGICQRMVKQAILLLTFAPLGLSACASSGGSSFGSGSPESSAAAAYAVVQELNNYRAIGGVGPVTLDSSLSNGAQLHANYLTVNSVSLAQVGLAAHTESPSMPGYTTAGASAGGSSVIYEGVAPVQAMDNWMQTLYHRLGLMDPNLTRVGFGSEGQYQVLDVAHGRVKGIGAESAISLFPWPGMQNVPGGYIREIPHPITYDDDIGIPITLEFFGNRGWSIESVQARIDDLTAGHQLGVYVQYPGHPFLAQWDLGQLIALIPESPLPRQSTIMVTISAQVDGAQFDAQWQFYTR